jgi:hypothetical protein
LAPSELSSAILASFAHDVGHPGLNNRFLQNSKDPLALVYNDRSVLENMHAATVFKLLSQESTNFMAQFENETWELCRKQVVDMILETDMAKHFDSFGALKMKVGH